MLCHLILDIPFRIELKISVLFLSEVVYGDVYMLDKEMKWTILLTPMPNPNSHIEFSWIIVNNSIIITGGTAEKHPVTKGMILVGGDFPVSSQLNGMILQSKRENCLYHCASTVSSTA